jgi:hypothetical protein
MSTCLNMYKGLFTHRGKLIKKFNRLAPTIRVFRVMMESDDDNLSLLMYLCSNVLKPSINIFYVQCYHCFSLSLFKNHVVNFCIV